MRTWSSLLALWTCALAAAAACNDSGGASSAEVCSGEQCASGCAATLTACTSGCVDTSSDLAHCGGCGNACEGACVAGQCVASNGEALGTAGGAMVGPSTGGAPTATGQGMGTPTAGGMAAGGSSGVATAGGAPAVAGASFGGASNGGTTSGGGPSAGASTGGASMTGGAGAAGAPACDTSWDTYADKGDGVALTPPLGWNSWNAFHENIDERQIREIADAMVSTGLRDAGYVYLNLDDKWMDDDGRDGSGRLVGDSARFPSGMAALAEYVHGKGLKFGLYGDRGTETCAHYNNNTPCESGSYGREMLDAETFASWGVDYLKYDNCAIAPGRDNDAAQQQDYEAMGNALRATGRPIVFSICAWDGKPWMPNVGHLWRSTFDIGPCFSGCNEWYRNIDQIIDENNETPDWAGPGHWNDPDMMVLGNPALTHDESVSHFSLWAIMAAPIILGNDLRSMSSELLGILTNEEVIAVNQDPAGIQGTRVADDGDREVWMKPLCRRDGPEKAVALFNRGGGSANVSVSFGDIGISGSATVRDLWAHQDLGESQQSFSTDVPSHGVKVLKIVQQ